MSDNVKCYEENNQKRRHEGQCLGGDKGEQHCVRESDRASTRDLSNDKDEGWPFQAKGTASTKASGGTQLGVSEEQAEGHSQSTQGEKRVDQKLGEKGWGQNIQDFRTS